MIYSLYAFSFLQNTWLCYESYSLFFIFLIFSIKKTNKKTPLAKSSNSWSHFKTIILKINELCIYSMCLWSVMPFKFKSLSFFTYVNKVLLKKKKKKHKSLDFNSNLKYHNYPLQDLVTTASCFFAQRIPVLCHLSFKIQNWSSTNL